MIKQDPLGDGISSVGFVDRMGTDLSVVNAARVSFDKQSEWESSSSTFPQYEPGSKMNLSQADTKLINYLASHNHWTPFGHAQISLRVKAPIFVARQLAKHQVGLVWNEVSRRYVRGTPEIYQPSHLRLAPEGNIKQGSSDRVTSAHTAQLALLAKDAVGAYTAMIADGVAPEEARMVLPLSMYTEWVWSGSLAAWMRIVKLRCDPHSQSQTRAYGQAFAHYVENLFPVSFAALNKP